MIVSWSLFAAQASRCRKSLASTPRPWYLGTEASGKHPYSRREGGKATHATGALAWLATGPIVTGRQVEILLGHFIAACVSKQAGLSVPRACCSFTRDAYCLPTRLWPTVRYECFIMSHLAMHLRSNWSRPWSNTAMCSDASPRGVGVGERTAAPETIASIARWNEKNGGLSVSPHA